MLQTKYSGITGEISAATNIDPYISKEEHMGWTDD
jgi:hypothetical protein